MYLKRKENFVKKENVFLNCPYNFKKKNSLFVFNCVNCENAPCISACKKNAIFYVAKGVVSIDHEKCDGCGECLKACEFSAIILKNNKAYKCDLCANSFFSMYCYKNNPDKLELVENILEKNQQEILNKYLGYVILENKDFLRKLTPTIVETKQGVKKYIIEHTLLSFQEIEIINYILDSYKNKTQSLETLSPEKVKKDIEKELIDFCYFNNIELDEDQFEYILEISFKNLYYYGAFTQVLKDPSLEEIVVLGENEPVYVYHRNFGWLETNLIYTSKLIIRDLINKLSWHSNKYITLKNPILDTYLEDNSRLNALLSPVTQSASLTIRKFTEKPFTIKDLINFKTLTKEVVVFLSLCFLSDLNIIVAGNTGSGKTTTLNTLLSFVPMDERFVIVEEVREINIPHKHKVFTLVNPDLDVTLENLVINTLRMRPDRVVIGEIRTKEESKYLIESMLCGQAKGTYTTFHSQNANEALLRFRSYGVLESDLGVIDLIIVQRRYNKYKEGKSIDLRNITEICEVTFKGNKLFLNTLYEYDISKEKLVKKNFPTKIYEKFRLSFSLKTKKDFEKLLKNQEKVIEDLLKGI